MTRNGALGLLLEDFISTGQPDVGRIVSAALRPRQVLVEQSPGRLEEITEGSTNERMRVKFQAMEVDTINRNLRVYPSAIIEREIGKLQKGLKEREVFSAADHPTDGKSSIPGTAALPDRLWINGNEVFGEATILKTRVGEDLQEIIRAGGKIGVSARGFGNLKEGEWEGKPAKIVQEDYELVTFDFVIGPGFDKATVRAFTEQVDTQGGEEMEIRSVEDLRRHHPRLVQEIEDAAHARFLAILKEGQENRLTELQQRQAGLIGDEDILEPTEQVRLAADARAKTRKALLTR